MLKLLIDRVHREYFSFLPRPRVVIGVPFDTTEVERKAVEDAAISAGAGRVYLVEEAILAAVGSRIPVKTQVSCFVKIRRSKAAPGVSAMPVFSVRSLAPIRRAMTSVRL